MKVLKHQIKFYLRIDITDNKFNTAVIGIQKRIK